MGLLFIVRHPIALDQVIVLLIRGSLFRLLIQQTGSIEIDPLQMVINEIDALCTPDKRIAYIGCMLGEQLIIQLHTQFCSQQYRNCSVKFLFQIIFLCFFT